MTKNVFPRCLELISGRFEDLVNFGKFGLKKGTGVDPPPPRGDNVPFFTVFLIWRLPLSRFSEEGGVIITSSCSGLLLLCLVDRWWWQRWWHWSKESECNHVPWTIIGYHRLTYPSCWEHHPDIEGGRWWSLQLVQPLRWKEPAGSEDSLFFFSSLCISRFWLCFFARISCVFVCVICALHNAHSSWSFLNRYEYWPHSCDGLQTAYRAVRRSRTLWKPPSGFPKGWNRTFGGKGMSETQMLFDKQRQTCPTEEKNCLYYDVSVLVFHKEVDNWVNDLL